MHSKFRELSLLFLAYCLCITGCTSAKPKQANTSSFIDKPATSPVDRTTDVVKPVESADQVYLRCSNEIEDALEKRNNFKWVKLAEERALATEQMAQGDERRYKSLLSLATAYDSTGNYSAEEKIYNQILALNLTDAQKALVQKGFSRVLAKLGKGAFIDDAVPYVREDSHTRRKRFASSIGSEKRQAKKLDSRNFCDESEIVGHTYKNSIVPGSYLRFDEDGNVEIHTQWSRYDGREMGELAGTYKVVDEIDATHIKIKYHFNGSDRSANYYKTTTKDGKLAFFSTSGDPMPMMIEKGY